MKGVPVLFGTAGAALLAEGVTSMPWFDVVLKCGELGLIALMIREVPRWIDKINTANTKERTTILQAGREEKEKTVDAFERRNEALAAVSSQNTKDLVGKIENQTQRLEVKFDSLSESLSTVPKNQDMKTMEKYIHDRVHDILNALGTVVNKLEIVSHHMSNVRCQAQPEVNEARSNFEVKNPHSSKEK